MCACILTYTLPVHSNQYISFLFVNYVFSVLTRHVPPKQFPLKMSGSSSPYQASEGKRKRSPRRGHWISATWRMCVSTPLFYSFPSWDWAFPILPGFHHPAWLGQCLHCHACPQSGLDASAEPCALMPSLPIQENHPAWLTTQNINQLTRFFLYNYYYSFHSVTWPKFYFVILQFCMRKNIRSSGPEHWKHQNMNQVFLCTAELLFFWHCNLPPRAIFQQFVLQILESCVKLQLQACTCTHTSVFKNFSDSLTADSRRSFFLCQFMQLEYCRLNMSWN